MRIKGFKNSYIYTEDKGICKTSMSFNNGLIASIGTSCDDGLIELPHDLIVVPGFVDEHIHGCFGHDTMDGDIESLKAMSNALVQEGVTSFLATTMTCDPMLIKKALKAIKETKDCDLGGAKVIGAHLEGPFISKLYKGAQDEKFIIPCSVESFKEFQEVSGNNIKIITLAYEEDGKELLKYLVKNNITASIGHSNATKEQTIEAINNGLSCTTHTFNAMNKEFGIIEAVLESSIPYNEMIADMHHLNEERILKIFNSKPKDKIILISDSTEAKYLEDGQYSLGGQPVFLKNGEVTLANGKLAGSVLRLDDALKNINKIIKNYTFEELIDLVTKNPAKNINVYDKCGSLSVNKKADCVIIDKEFNVYATIVDGDIKYMKKGLALS